VYVVLTLTRPGKASQKLLLGISSTPVLCKTNFCTVTPTARYTTTKPLKLQRARVSRQPSES
jgi:hypothetical protein